MTFAASQISSTEVAVKPFASIRRSAASSKFTLVAESVRFVLIILPTSRYEYAKDMGNCQEKINPSAIELPEIIIGRALPLCKRRKRRVKDHDWENQISLPNSILSRILPCRLPLN